MPLVAVSAASACSRRVSTRPARSSSARDSTSIFSRVVSPAQRPVSQISTCISRQAAIAKEPRALDFTGDEKTCQRRDFGAQRGMRRPTARRLVLGLRGSVFLKNRSEKTPALQEKRGRSFVYCPGSLTDTGATIF